MNQNISEPLRVILADDHPAVLQSWKYLLGTNPRYEVVADCLTGESAIEMALDLRPDLLVVDLHMKPVSGFHVMEEVRDRLPGTKLVGTTMNESSKAVSRLLEIGAHGMISQTSSIQEISKGLEVVMNGHFFISRDIHDKLSADEVSRLNLS